MRWRVHPAGDFFPLHYTKSIVRKKPARVLSSSRHQGYAVAFLPPLTRYWSSRTMIAAISSAVSEDRLLSKLPSISLQPLTVPILMGSLLAYWVI